ncbi:MAG: HDOD domain-containing protein [Proteobacteria bacterium]|nr:HDOD domain-containing protein [Pseudomonadota bacterium]MBU1687628.1 HDOD domain-containing protein [Pseudomonadota bacterium]
MADNHFSETDFAKKINFLKNIPFFSDFDDSELRQFLTVSTWLKVPKDTMIIQEEALEKVFYILVKGEVSVFKNRQDSTEPIHLTTLTTGDCFGEMALVSEVRRTAGVITTTECFILRVEPDIINTSSVFLQLKFYKRFCEIMVSRLDLANRRMAAWNRVNKSANQAGSSPQTKARSRSEDHSETEDAPVPPMPERKEKSAQVRIQNHIDPAIPLPINPIVAAQLAPFLSGSWSNTRLLADLIHLDPAISFRVLKVANSSLYRRSCQVISVPHALVSLGPAVIQEELGRAIADSRDLLPFGGSSLLGDEFWRHGVVVGKIAALLRDILRLTNVLPDVYLAGLLHDIGMLVLDPFEPDFYPQLIREDHGFTRINLAEKEYIGMDHGLAGKWLAEKSGIPAPYQDVMRFHHEPTKAAGDHLVLICLVHLANLFAASRGACPGDPELIGSDPVQSEAWDFLKREIKTFTEVKPSEFVADVNRELDRSWGQITGEIIF